MDSRSVVAKAGMGIAVSTLCNSEEHLADNEKTVFDWCAEQNVKKVTGFLTDKKVNVNCKNKDVSCNTAKWHRIMLK